MHSTSKANKFSLLTLPQVFFSLLLVLGLVLAAPSVLLAEEANASPKEESKNQGVQNGVNLRHYLSYDSTSRVLDEDVSEIQSFGDGLDLSNTDVVDADLKQLKGPAFADVKWLNLRGTAITDEGLKYLKTSPIKTLVLEDTEITGMGFPYLKGLPLKYLTLEGTQVTDATLSALKGLPLVFLDLTGTLVSDEGLPLLVGLPLTSLKLYSTQVTDIGLQYLPLLKLKKVYLTGTGITPQGIESFKRRNPDTEVIY